MSFSMLFCIVFTMGAVFFDCKWEKVPNLWIIAGLQISMAGASVRRGDTGAWQCGHSLLGRNISGSFSFLSFVSGEDDRNRRYQGAGGTRQRTGTPENTVLHRDGISSGCRGISFSSFFSL